jgi:hypothetical protein
MTKVILIAVVSLLAVVRTAGGPRLAAATDYGWATLTPEITVSVGGGVAVQEFKPFFPEPAHNHATASTFASLVSVNRLDSVERPLGGQLALALAEREAEASWRPAENLGPDSGQTSEWRWDRVAVLNTAATALAQRRPQWRHARGRKSWPLRRPSHGAQVWLTRKQP